MTARARGSHYRRWKLAELTHIVECPIPGSGLRSRLDAMHAWCREHCGPNDCADSKHVDRAPGGMPQDVLLWHFRDAATARAFAAAFDLSA